MRKVAAIVLSLALFFTSIPMPIAFAYPNTEDEFFEYLISQGQLTRTPEGRKANFQTFKNYGLVVYGDPWGDTGDSICSDKTWKQSRYLGYDVNDKSYTNPCFRADELGGLPPEQWNYIPVENAAKSWNNLEEAQENHMMYSQLYGNGAKSSTFNVAYIGGENYARVQSAAIWKASGSVYTKNRGRNGKEYYATFSVAPMVGGQVLDGRIVGPSTCVIMKPDETSIKIPYEVIAELNLSGRATDKQVQTLKAEGGEKMPGTSAAKAATVTHRTEITVNRSSFPASTAVQTVDVPLTGRVYVKNIFNEEETKYVSGTACVQIEPTADPVITIDAKNDPESKRFEGKDTPVKISVKARLNGYDNTDNISHWVLSVWERGNTSTTQSVTLPGKTLSAAHDFTFVIPASRGEEWVQQYDIEAKAYFAKPFPPTPNPLPARTWTQTVIFSEAPDPPSNPKPTNIPPVAKINGPNEVKAGEEFMVDGYFSYDEDGEIVFYDWKIRFEGSWSGPEVELQLDDPGTYELYLTVTDDDGASDTAKKEIEVLPPYPNAQIETWGTYKENRRIVLDGSKSESPDKYRITNYEWKITPISDGTAQDIKYVGNLNGDQQIRVLFKKPGQYMAELTVTNRAGYSDTETLILNIEPDQPPIPMISTLSTIYRDPYYGLKARMKLQDHSISPDGDIIAQRIWTLRYDSDNDGDFSDESVISLDTGNKEYLEYDSDFGVGRYEVTLTVKENFGPDQTTIPQFVTDADYRRASTTHIIEVDNHPPVASLGLTKKKYVDIHINMGDTAHNLSTVQSKVNSILLPELAADGIQANIQYTNYKPYVENRVFSLTGSTYDSDFKIFDPNDYSVTIVPARAYSGSATVHEDGKIYYISNHDTFDNGVSGAGVAMYDPNTNRKELLLDVDALPDNEIENLVVSKNGKFFFTMVVRKKGDDDIYIMELDPVTRAWRQVMLNREIYRNFAVSTGHIVFQHREKDWLYLFNPNSGYIVDSIKPDDAEKFTPNIGNEFLFYYTSPSYSLADNIEYVSIYGNSMDRVFVFDSNYVTSMVSTGLPHEYFVYISSVQDEEDFEEPGWYLIHSRSRTKQRIYMNLWSLTPPTFDKKNYFTPNYQELWVFDGNTRQFKKVGPYVNLGEMVTYTLTNNPPKRGYIALGDHLAGLSWNEHAQHYYLDISDVKRTELDNPNQLGQAIAELLKHDVRFYALGKSANQGQYQALIAKNENNGRYFDNGNLDAALTAIRDEIVTRANDRANMTEAVILLGESVDYHTSYLDIEEDPKYAERWKYDHNPRFIRNQGVIPQNGQYLPAPITTFNHVGQFNITYQAQDNPKPDNRFANYRKWSQNPGGQMILNVHRKPVAQFTIWQNPDGTLEWNDTSYDPDRWYSESEYSTEPTGIDYRTTRGIFDRRYKFISPSGNMYDYQLTRPSEIGTYRVGLQVVDEFGAWSDWTFQDLNIGFILPPNTPPEAYLSFPYGTQDSPNVISTMRPTITWRQTDADPGTVFTAFQIQITNEQNTIMILDSGQLPQSTSSTSGAWTVNKDLPAGQKMRVRVRVSDGQEWSNWSLPAWMIINRPPIADFTWMPNPAWEGDTVRFIPNARDPDGDRLTYHWRIQFPDGGEMSYSGESFSHRMILPGEYKVTLTVSDQMAEHSATKPVLVRELTIQSFVDHTPEWEEKHRKMKHNTTVVPKDFYSGEVFVVTAVSSPVPVKEVSAWMDTKDKNGERIFLHDLLEPSGSPNVFKGELFDPRLMSVTGGLPQGIQHIHFQIRYQNGVTKQNSVPVHIIGNVHGSYGVHRLR